MNISALPRIQMMARGLLFAALLTTAGVPHVWGANLAEDRAKGEEMLRLVRVDLAEANRQSDLAAQSLQTAQREQETADQKRLQAHQLEREAFLLIRDSKRMAAAELRATAEREEQQVKNQTVQLQYLKAQLANQNKIAADATTAAARMKDAARDESDAQQKTELGKMADALSAQVVQANGEAAVLEQRIGPIQAEIQRLDALISRLNESADRLAPVEK